MRTAAYNVGVASVYVSLRSLLDERHWRSATRSAREYAEAHSYLKGVVDDERFYIQCTTGYYFWKR